MLSDRSYVHIVVVTRALRHEGTKARRHEGGTAATKKESDGNQRGDARLITSCADDVRQGSATPMAALSNLNRPVLVQRVTSEEAKTEFPVEIRRTKRVRTK